MIDVYVKRRTQQKIQNSSPFTPLHCHCCQQYFCCVLCAHQSSKFDLQSFFPSLSAMFFFHLAFFFVLRSCHILVATWLHCRPFFTCVDGCRRGSQNFWCLIIDFSSLPIFFLVYSRQTSPRRCEKSGTVPSLPARACGMSVDFTKELVKKLSARGGECSRPPPSPSEERGLLEGKEALLVLELPPHWP